MYVRVIFEPKVTDPLCFSEYESQWSVTFNS